MNDENEYWADRRCVKCDRHLDRRGAMCSDCMEESQEAIEREDRAAKEERRIEQPWKLLNSQFQKIFVSKK